MRPGARRRGREGTHRGAAAGVEEEVGGVSRGRRLVGDGPVAERHAHDRRHVRLRAKDVDGDPGGLPCMCIQEHSAFWREKEELCAKMKHFSLRKLRRKKVEKNKMQNQNLWKVLTNFSHDT